MSAAKAKTEAIDVSTKLGIKSTTTSAELYKVTAALVMQDTTTKIKSAHRLCSEFNTDLKSDVYTK